MELIAILPSNDTWFFLVRLFNQQSSRQSSVNGLPSGLQHESVLCGQAESEDPFTRRKTVASVSNQHNA